ncbi:hypothetical protein KY389_09970 [Paracoccus bogoriensis]|uniref:hypothetical protein n=1 Tax=Paracoccus bogoriensis TaxID=242065 RepID=UPI001CA5E24A|nr:hypothetical protein [Paracoccus bogoriensis]MBW7057015.1 hypothetical protein [Paracoccus bogoriensis]
MLPKFFQIGFNKCGTTFIARLFDMNGIPAAHWLEGALAEDIAYAKLTGARPLARWADRVTAFTDMESARFLNMPIIEAFKDYAFLDAHYPGAVFMLNTRRVEDWIASRYLHRGGAYARSHAAWRGVALGDLADLWAQEWQAHLKGVRQHFAGRPEFIEIDIDEATPEDYRRALSPWFDLPRIPDLPGAGVRQARLHNLPRLRAMLETPLPGAGYTPTSRLRLARRLTALAAPARLSLTPALRAPHEQAVCLDLDRAELRGADGRLLPLRRGPQGFYLEAKRPGLLRVAPVANDIAQVATGGCYWLDMRPSGPNLPAEAPLLACLRRRGAANVYLWPAPWLHRIGNDGFPGAPLPRRPALADRPDLAVWRGRLSGRGADGRSAEQMLHALAAGHGGLQALRALTGLPRWRLASLELPGLDAAILPDARLEQALAQAGLTPPRLAADHPAGRYAISLASTEGDSDLLPLIQDEAVVLAEDDGTESFVTGLFRPWRHVIPLEPGAADLTEKLAWARAHPETCAQIATRARRLAARLADPQARRLHLARVIEAYRAATGQL